jgi:hypothetical protein
MKKATKILAIVGAIVLTGSIAAAAFAADRSSHDRTPATTRDPASHVASSDDRTGSGSETPEPSETPAHSTGHDGHPSDDSMSGSEDSTHGHSEDSTDDSVSGSDDSTDDSVSGSDDSTDDHSDDPIDDHGDDSISTVALG